MEPADAAPGGRDEEVDGAIAVDVAHADRVEAEGVAGDAAGEGLHQVAVLAGVEVRAPSGHGGARVLPGADDEIGVPVVVDVARVGRPDAEALAGRLAGQRQETFAVVARVDVDASGLRSLCGV